MLRHTAADATFTLAGGSGSAAIHHVLVAKGLILGRSEYGNERESPEGVLDVRSIFLRPGACPLEIHARNPDTQAP